MAQPLTQDQCRDAFATTVSELLTGVQAIFPECREVMKVIQEFGVMSSNKTGIDMLLHSWHNNMQPLYGACIERDEKVFLTADIGILKRLGITEKYRDPRFNQESKAALWAFIDELNHLACEFIFAPDTASTPNNTSNSNTDDAIYQHVPQTAALKIQDVTRRLREQLERGEVSLNSLDPFALSQQVTQDLSPEDLAAIRENSPSIMSALLNTETGQQAQSLFAQNPDLVMNMLNQNRPSQ